MKSEKEAIKNLLKITLMLVVTFNDGENSNCA